MIGRGLSNVVPGKYFKRLALKTEIAAEPSAEGVRAAYAAHKRQGAAPQERI